MILNLNTLDNMKLIDYLNVIDKFLKEYLVSSHQEGYVLGVSGGVDSSLTAALVKKAVGKDKLLCVLIPIESRKEDLEDGLKLVHDLDLNYVIIDGNKQYQAYIDEFKKNNIELDASTKGNLKARIRMSILYALAQARRSLVVGTDNRDERYVGYFTKFGDGGVDLLPIAKLTKHEVVEAAKIMGIDSHLADRVPSAGLFEGQTDEKEMGIKYVDLDNFLLGKEIDESSKSRIEHLHNISEHKRNEIPEPEDFIREK